MVGNPSWREAFHSRNEDMRRWAAAYSSGRVHLLDFAALAGAPGAPRGLAANWTDWHYSCKFSWDEPQVSVPSTMKDQFRVLEQSSRHAMPRYNLPKAPGSVMLSE